ncbi:conserved hypothetical protein [Histoplasma capsulatum var. duboisii H88]|uniref:Uncharacterized protein n=1 Tax=Ajellomyces capsulatus (strain H88) TaxID=544711 RepID=F0UFZ4_AJEC8|nr:conserved hypothetical protein [Histoplasma capsulatum var. duboisii H88]
MPAVTINNIQFYQPSNLLNSLKPQNLRLATNPTPFNPSAQRLFPITDIFSSLSHLSQQLRHSLPSHLSSSTSSLIFHTNIAVKSISEFELHTYQADESREIPLITADEVITFTGLHTHVSPCPQSQSLIPVDHVSAVQKRWLVKKVLNSQIHMQGATTEQFDPRL